MGRALHAAGPARLLARAVGGMIAFGPEFIALVVAMFVAGGISGMTGFGVGVVGSIAMAVVVGPKQAVILLSIISSFAATNQVLKFRRDLAVVERLKWMIAAALVGAVIGSWLLLWLPYSVLASLLGVFTITYVVMSLIGFRPKVTYRAERVLSPSVGLLAGVVNSTVGSSGPVLGPYLLAIGVTQSAFVISVSVAFLIMGLVRVLTLAGLHAYTWPIVESGLALLIPTFAGQFTGFWLQSRVPTHIFERLVLALLAVAAVYLIYRGLGTALR